MTASATTCITRSKTNEEAANHNHDESTEGNVIKVARNHLVQLEQDSLKKNIQPDLFSIQPPETLESTPQHIHLIAMLEALSPDELTPKQALEKIYALKKALEDD